MNLKIENAKKQIKRVLISYNDIAEATNYTNQILKHKYHEPDYLKRLDDPGEDFLNSDDHENMKALTTALIISYSRPFTKNEGHELALSSIPNNILKSYDTFEMDLHNKILNLRNKAFAHSDADLTNVELIISEYDGKLHRSYSSNYSFECFTKIELELLLNMLDKLFYAFGDYISDIFHHFGDGATKYFVNN